MSATTCECSHNSLSARDAKSPARQQAIAILRRVRNTEHKILLRRIISNRDPNCGIPAPSSLAERTGSEAAIFSKVERGDRIPDTAATGKPPPASREAIGTSGQRQEQRIRRFPREPDAPTRLVKDKFRYGFVEGAAFEGGDSTASSNSSHNSNARSAAEGRRAVSRRVRSGFAVDRLPHSGGVGQTVIASGCLAFSGDLSADDAGKFRVYFRVNTSPNIKVERGAARVPPIVIGTRAAAPSRSKSGSTAFGGRS